MLIVGLMSGTSVDGIDAALVDIHGEGRATRVELLNFLCLPFPDGLRAAILSASSAGEGSAASICALNAALGERFAEAAIEFARAAGTPLTSIEAIASHGQTIWHQPEAVQIGGEEARGTMQIGEPAIIAARTGCNVISNFRAADMAAGGQGAPLVPYFDWALLASDEESRAVLNLGGISNLTHLPKGATIDQVTAFDTGPGNMVIDEMAHRFSHGQRRIDLNGELAAAGEVDRLLVESILGTHPYFSQPPPKSTGRETFGNRFVDSLLAEHSQSGAPANLIATATALTAAAIKDSILRWLVPRGGVDNLIVGGGGVHNLTLMRMISESVSPIRVTSVEEFGISNDAKEAMAFALLGYETLHGRPSNVPTATGASRRVVLGSITTGN